MFDCQGSSWVDGEILRPFRGGCRRVMTSIGTTTGAPILVGAPPGSSGNRAERPATTPPATRTKPDPGNAGEGRNAGHRAPTRGFRSHDMDTDNLVIAD